MPEIILTGISSDQLLDSIRATVKSEIERILIGVQKSATSPELITRKETAQLLGISLPTLNEWTKNGVLPAQRIGTRIRYNRADVYSKHSAIYTLAHKKAHKTDMNSALWAF